jgi:hypothetical protein
MTRDEAERRRVELVATDPSQTWLLRERDGDWGVVKVDIPGARRPKLTPTIEAAPNPQADDPRPAGQRNIPPYGPIFG